MNTTIQELRAIYVALGGTSTEITDTMLIPEALAKIATQITSALASVLPAVSKTDEGKVLKVDSNGKWAVGTDEIQA